MGNSGSFLNAAGTGDSLLKEWQEAPIFGARSERERYTVRPARMGLSTTVAARLQLYERLRASSCPVVESTRAKRQHKPWCEKAQEECGFLVRVGRGRPSRCSSVTQNLRKRILKRDARSLTLCSRRQRRQKKLIMNLYGWPLNAASASWPMRVTAGRSQPGETVEPSHESQRVCSARGTQKQNLQPLGLEVVAVVLLREQNRYC